MILRVPLKRIIMNLLIILWVLLEVKWFYLPSNTHSILVKYNFDGKNLAIVVISFLMLFIQLSLTPTRKRRFLFQNQIFIIWIVWVIAYFYAAIRYQQDPMYTFNQFIYFGLYVLYFALIWYFEGEGYQHGYDFFLTVFALGTAIFSTLIVIQAYYIQMEKGMFLTILEYLDRDMVFRHSLIRIMSPSILLSFSAVLSFSKLMQKKNKSVLIRLIDIWNVVAGTIYIFYACGTRFLMLILLMCYGITVICKKEREHFIHKLVLYIVAVCALYYTITHNAFYSLSFNTEENSFVTRLGSYSYFLEKGFLNPICGLGFLTDHATSFRYLLHGENGRNYISDVGIIGFMGQMGLIAALAYLSMVVKMWRINYRVKRECGFYNPIILVICCYVTLTLPTLSLQTNITIVGMVMSLILVEFEYKMEVEKLY